MSFFFINKVSGLAHAELAILIMNTATFKWYDKQLEVIDKYVFKH
jgi:hypothetical protein